MFKINADEYFSFVEFCDKLLASDIAIICNVFIIIIIIYLCFLYGEMKGHCFKTQ